MAAAGRTYVDFVPPHNLLEETDKVVLRVDLSAEGFAKEQLRVQIDKFGRLRISGERPLRADSNRWRRFSKDFQVPEGCDAGAVRARLEKGGVLLITMPRLSSSPAPKLAEEPTAAGAKAGGVDARDQQKDHTASAQQEAPPASAQAGDEKKEDRKDEARRDTSTERGDQDEQHVASNGAAGGAATAQGFAKSRKGMVWAIVAMVLALVGAGLYARYRMMDPSAETASAGSQIAPLSDN